MARYEDGQWYRASVERVHAADPTAPEYDVYFVDFGNRQRAKGAAVRPMDAALAAVAPQATPATLAFVKVGGLVACWSEGGGRKGRASEPPRQRAWCRSPSCADSDAAGRGGVHPWPLTSEWVA